MPYEFKLPDLGEGITEAEIRKWLVKEGDDISEHQNVLEVETDKAVTEVPSPKAGKVLKLNKEEGETAKVGETLLTLAQAGEPVQKIEKAGETCWEIKPEMEEEGVKSRPESVSVVGELPEKEEETVLASPAVRARAREMGVDLKGMKGSGPGGIITEKDLLKRKAPAPVTEEYGPVERVPLRGLRKTISRNLMNAQKNTAFVTGMEEADITELWEMREREKGPLKEQGLHLTFLPFIIKAVQHALAEHPRLNSSMDEEREEIILKKYYNIGIAVDTPEGLMVPVIKGADKKTILELAAEIEELSGKARTRKVRMDELKGGTFTITNFGHFGGLFATPIINYPEAAILGTGRIAMKPWVRDSRIEIRKIIPLSLTFDHRVTDGADASGFLFKIVKFLEEPALLFLESA